MLPSWARWVPRSLAGAHAKAPLWRRSPVRFRRASGNASHSRDAWAASSSGPCSGSGVSGSSYWKPSAHSGSNPAGSRPDHARSQASKSSSMCTLTRMPASPSGRRPHPTFAIGATDDGPKALRLPEPVPRPGGERRRRPDRVRRAGALRDGDRVAERRRPRAGGARAAPGRGRPARRVWADRLPRTQVMISTDLVRFALHALLAALIFTGAVEVWHIVAIEALFGTADAFFKPALTGLVPQTVPEG